MYEVIKSAVIDLGIYSLFALIYASIGAYQNINIWGQDFDWKKYLNGLVKYLALGVALVATVVGAYILLDQSAKQGVELVNAQAIAPRVILGVVLLASAGLLVKIVKKIGTTFGLSDEQLKTLQEQSVNTESDKPLILDINGIPSPSKDYVIAKKNDEADPENTGVGTNYSVPIGSYDAFRGAVLGNGYDIDNYYGYQCWDGTALLWQQLGRSLVTGNGLAIGCWDLKRDVNKYDQFDLVGDVNSLQRGDVVVMRPNHIGFFDGYDGNYMVILGQNQGGVAYSNGGSKFNIARISKSAFAGAFRYRGWHSAAPAPAPTPAPATKSIDEVAKEALRGDWGNGADRTTRLAAAGYDPSAVQAKVNELIGNSAPAPAKKSVDEIAAEVLRGDWGNGDDRKARLAAAGYDYATVQAKVNESAPAPAPAAATATIGLGDTVVPTALVDYKGRALKSYDQSYTVSEINGDRAVLTARGQVWAAMNVANLRKA